ncbi:rhodanese-like domain-containing protein [Gordonia sp. (in: high G+C Gram-positive bacteria)]|jgi:rhodanese-related sulfurtransferase|uniref:rhodanese-like domain-containing protein n=1 Tax=Gordonia sp. (in: high G+C Gram-positive bacteria) TaxID=84139 RepID=UPI001DEDE064|nr:rhodanese-like domain-containing protein [Gordonia sp. (in: high G+C Gram-positive bacteria)]MCB1294930.1 sulfurtransferase [Gordonia sp. (in: high G+C Gram-positive bacteria)]HMS77555.1 rhodanese-like domain-containing protein [Gordonia sp. (in: high G+C Gram-positive bacteria)]HQV20890.1 rhodanese-like domain-containing protein [Gordonia sp. (in: high G+C Gram-positive bacteria)]
MITAADFFAAKLAYEIDPADLAARRLDGNAPTVIDVRSQQAWEQGHLPHAVHIPNPELVRRIKHEVPDQDTDLVVYCWGPGCNGATKAALTLVQSGYSRVRELIGGFEYWAREGLSIVDATGRTLRSPDPLTAPTG